MKLKIFSTLLIAAVFTSCYKYPNDTIYIEDLDMVKTDYKLDLNYPQEYTTFTIADSFALATNVEGITPDDANDPSFVIPVKQSILKNMQDYGYVYIPLDSADSTNIPDIYIPITVSYVNTSGVAYYPIYSPGYGWGYGGGYYGGWYGGYYGYWNYYPTSYSYDQGSLLIDWLDVKNGKILNDSIFISDIVWNLSITGIIENSSPGQDRTDRLHKAIDTGFEQSPYLKK